MWLPRIAKITLTLAGTLLLAACIPSPHYDVMASPAIDGTVHRGGQPVAGARLYVAGGGACIFQGKPLATSDADGAFHIPLRQTTLHFLVRDPGQGPSWRLCIADGDRHYEGWHEEYIIHYDISLDCDLESPSRDWRWHVDGPYAGPTATGLCRSHADEQEGRLSPAPGS